MGDTESRNVKIFWLEKQREPKKEELAKLIEERTLCRLKQKSLENQTLEEERVKSKIQLNALLEQSSSKTNAGKPQGNPSIRMRSAVQRDVRPCLANRDLIRSASHSPTGVEGLQPPS